MNTKAKTLLKSKGIKLTKGRIGVLSAVLSSPRPLSCEELFLQISASGEDINLSTVYRIAAGLLQNGLLNAVSLSGAEKTLYEYNSGSHRHLIVCLGCNKILPLLQCPLDSYQRDVEKKTGFTIKGHNLDLYGYCPECAKTAPQK